MANPCGEWPPQCQIVIERERWGGHPYNTKGAGCEPAPRIVKAGMSPVSRLAHSVLGSAHPSNSIPLYDREARSI